MGIKISPKRKQKFINPNDIILDAKILEFNKPIVKIRAPIKKGLDDLNTVVDEALQIPIKKRKKKGN